MNINDKQEIIEISGGFHDLVGIDKAVIQPNGMASIELKIESQHANVYGIVHGGVLFTLADSSVGVYAYYHGLKPVTLDSYINYYRPAVIGDTIYTEVTPKKIGKTISTYLCEMKNQEGQLIAEMTATMYHTVHK